MFSYFIFIAAGRVRPDQLAKVVDYPQGPNRKLKADENVIFNGTFVVSR